MKYLLYQVNSKLNGVLLNSFKNKLYGPKIIIEAISHHLNLNIGLLTHKLTLNDYQQDKLLRDYFFKLQLKRNKTTS